MDTRTALNRVAYEDLFRSLGIRGFESHRALRHPRLRITVYFNHTRAGAVSFVANAKDERCFRPELWQLLPPQKTKDDDPCLRTFAPWPGKERAALEDLLITCGTRPLDPPGREHRRVA